jgi:uncharacterized protein (DUF697 family)
MINKLLNGFNTATQISNIVNSFSGMNQEAKSMRANDIIKNHVGFAASAGLIPIPGADLAAVTAVQLNMLRQLANVYDVKFMDSIGKNIITAIAGSSIARLGASLVKIIPGVGTVIGEMSMAALSAASTYALGKMFARHFDNGGTLDNFDMKFSKKVYEEELKNGKNVAKEVVNTEGVKASDSTDDLMTKLKKLAELKDAGVLSEEEFLQMKTKLISQF